MTQAINTTLNKPNSPANALWIQQKAANDISDYGQMIAMHLHQCIDSQETKLYNATPTGTYLGQWLRATARFICEKFPMSVGYIWSGFPDGINCDIEEYHILVTSDARTHPKGISCGYSIEFCDDDDDLMETVISGGLQVAPIGFSGIQLLSTPVYSKQ